MALFDPTAFKDGAGAQEGGILGALWARLNQRPAGMEAPPDGSWFTPGGPLDNARQYLGQRIMLNDQPMLPVPQLRSTQGYDESGFAGLPQAPLPVQQQQPPAQSPQQQPLAQAQPQQQLPPPMSLAPPLNAPQMPQQQPQMQQPPSMQGQQVPGQQAAPQQSENPGMTAWNHLRMGAQNLSTGGNPFAALLNSVHGLATGQSTMQPKLVELGADPLTGTKQFGTYDPGTQQMKPLQMTNNGTPQAATADAVASKITSMREAGAPRAKMLEQMPPAWRGYINDLLDGRALPGNLGRPGAARAQLIAMAHTMEPGFDETRALARQAWAKAEANTSANAAGGQLLRVRTILQHTNDGLNAADEFFKHGSVLGSTDALNSLNSTKSYLRSQMGDKDYLRWKTEYDANLKVATGELETLLSGSHGAEGSKEYWLKRLNLDNGPTAVKAGWAAMMKAMAGRLGPFAQMKSEAYGVPTDPQDLLDPKQRKIFERAMREHTETPQNAAAPQSAQPLKPGTYNWTPHGIQ